MSSTIPCPWCGKYLSISAIEEAMPKPPYPRDGETETEIDCRACGETVTIVWIFEPAVLTVKRGRT